MKKAKEQLREVENPSKSMSWKEVQSLRKLTQMAEELGLLHVVLGGGLIRKRTWFLTSSEEVAEELRFFNVLEIITNGALVARRSQSLLVHTTWSAVSCDMRHGAGVCE